MWQRKLCLLAFLCYFLGRLGRLELCVPIALRAFKRNHLRDDVSEPCHDLRSTARIKKLKNTDGSRDLGLNRQPTSELLNILIQCTFNNLGIMMYGCTCVLYVSERP